jgi:enoyl-CoA hydratase
MGQGTKQGWDDFILNLRESMMSNEVLVEAIDGVALITLNAPERRNAFTVPMAEEFIAVLRDIDADRSVAATVLNGAGIDFCSGGDLATLTAVGDEPFSEDSWSGLRTIYDSFVTFGSIATPTIAAVHGGAVGAGLNLALAATLRVVAHDAKLMSGFLRIGIHPGGGHFHLLERYVGQDTAAALSIFGEQLNGDDAVRLGLAWRAVPQESVLETAMEIARRIRRNPDLARAALRSWRTESRTSTDWTAAVDIERLPQLRTLWQKSHTQ